MNVANWIFSIFIGLIVGGIGGYILFLIVNVFYKSKRPVLFQKLFIWSVIVLTSVGFKIALSNSGIKGNHDDCEELTHLSGSTGYSNLVDILGEPDEMREYGGTISVKWNSVTVQNRVVTFYFNYHGHGVFADKPGILESIGCH